MPRRFPVTSTEKAIRALKLFGCWMERHGKGDHIIIKRRVANGEIGSSLPRRKELPEATLRNALRDLMIDDEDYIRAWRSL